MPIYLYRCSDCLGEWKENHGMTETGQDCLWCDSANVNRVPAMFSNLSKKEKQKRKVGDITKEFIECSKEDLQTQKKELDKER